MSNGIPRNERWARFRYAVVGRLLASPPRPRQLARMLRRLATKSWTHPISGEQTRFAYSTIERWFHVARKSRDPVAALRRKVRSDVARSRLIVDALADALRAQYRQNPCWSYQLHRDNLAAQMRRDPQLGARAPSAETVRRFMRSGGLVRRRRPRRDTEGAVKAEARRHEREVRSYEKSHVHALWHTDFHHGSRAVLTSSGSWIKPILLAFLDDRSRLVCHAQWYLGETAGDLVHGLAQALQKRGLPRALMHDNGAAMKAAEFREGLERLGIISEPTLEYSPYQNGKLEVFWVQVEGRLLPMLDKVVDLSLEMLNEATLAWIEGEYNRAPHRGIARKTPVERLLEGPSVGRPCPVTEELRIAFTIPEHRRQRTSDGTLTIAGVRFEVPSRHRHVVQLTVRYARWDLSRAYLVCPRTGDVLERLMPIDKERNADARRRALPTREADTAEATDEASSAIAPLLADLIREQRQLGLPPAYLHRDEGPVDTASTE